MLYPEAVGLSADIDRSVAALHARRIVAVDEPNPHPITDAAREVLFTSNVLLGLPLDAGDVERAERDPHVAAAVARAKASAQLYWFDHPIPVGVEPEANELLQGLRGLDAAMRAEPGLADPGPDGRPPPADMSPVRLGDPCRAARHRPALRRAGAGRGPALEQVDVLVASEIDVRQLVDEVLNSGHDQVRTGLADEPGPGGPRCRRRIRPPLFVPQGDRRDLARPRRSRRPGDLQDRPRPGVSPARADRGNRAHGPPALRDRRSGARSAGMPPGDRSSSG